MFSVKYLGSKNNKQIESHGTFQDLTGDIFVLKNKTVMYTKTIFYPILLEISWPKQQEGK